MSFKVPEKIDERSLDSRSDTETDISTYKEKKITINYEENQTDSTTFFDSIIELIPF